MIMTTMEKNIAITDVIGRIPYRMALAGGWIDQPFISRHNPEPPGSMVVVSIHPTMRFMDRCGMGTSTRKVMTELWNGQIPEGDPMDLVRKSLRRRESMASSPLRIPGYGRHHLPGHQPPGLRFPL